MELLLVRDYFLSGCNGQLYCGNQRICATIELPWNDNQVQVSCIPEGRYPIEKRYSRKFGWHLWVKGVEGRTLILIHPANDALQELKGCIAPVSRLTGPGKGRESRVAMHQLKQLVYRSLSKRIPVYLTIKKRNYANKN